MTNQLELDLRNAGDAAEVEMMLERPARDGETCTVCGGEFEEGEIIDIFFGPTHLKCYEAEFGGNDGA